MPRLPKEELGERSERVCSWSAARFLLLQFGKRRRKEMQRYAEGVEQTSVNLIHERYDSL